MFFFSFCLILLLLAVLVICPDIDLKVASLFYEEGQGFFLSRNSFLHTLKYIAFIGSRIMAVGFLVFGLVAWVRKKHSFGKSSKAWFFLLCCLLVGPGLFANVIFKEHWGRARPRDVVVFGGEASFTPAAVMTDQCYKNCSFVSGDASFGFFLTSFVFVVSASRRRKVFLATLAVGSIFAGARVIMGAHFLSDTVFALALIMVVNTGLSVAFWGRWKTGEIWRDILFKR